MIEIVLSGVVLVLCIPMITLAVELLAAAVSRTSVPARALISRLPGTVAVIVPAHDEENGILATLQGITSQMLATDRLLVIADNCSDATAEIARGAGAEVSERKDASRRGKGYALDWAIRVLRQQPPDVVVVIDADCSLGDSSLSALANACLRSNRPVQALNLMRAPENSSKSWRIHEFTWKLKNHIRPLGMSSLGLPCPLMGTGMAVPWAAIELVDLANDNLIEDIKLGLDLAEMKFAPQFCPSALVSSTFARTEEGVVAQRTRWERGSASLLVSNGPRYLWRALLSRNWRLAALALDLLIPPLTLFACLIVGVWFVTAAAALGGFGLVPVTLLSAVGAVAVIGLLLAVVRFSPEIFDPRLMGSFLAYLGQKLRVYRWRPRHPIKWTRSDRS